MKEKYPKTVPYQGKKNWGAQNRAQKAKGLKKEGTEI